MDNPSNNVIDFKPIEPEAAINDTELNNVSDSSIKNVIKFDFDDWKELNESSPDDFEQYRTFVIENVISSFPKENQKRLRAVQWRLDQERRLHSSKMGACIHLYTRMWEYFAQNFGRSSNNK
ncbi:MAG: DUF3135 domain-containing protein [Candidatus Thiodiazotropha taylori]